MRNLNGVLATLLPASCIALVFTLAPVDSRYTAGIIGAEPLCAQDQGAINRCIEAWRDQVESWDRHCPPGTRAHCEVSCGLDGSGGQSHCICAQ